MTRGPLLNPDDFVIARRRKKFRFAWFANLENCYECEEWRADAPKLTGEIVVELGAGTGLFSTELATRHPNTTYVALDVKADRLQKGARLATERGLSNIFFVRARADQVAELFGHGTVEAIWLTFSDPFPKKSDAKRRLTHEKFLKIYTTVLKEKGVLYQKTDNHALFDWSLEQLVQNGWTLRELSYDLHDSGLHEDYKIVTTYEKRWLSEGLVTMFVQATRAPGEPEASRR